MRHAIGTIPFLLAMAALPAAGQLPASCGGVGAKSYTTPALTIPPVVLNRGTVITVTNATGVVNGDTSSVKALMANPGPDGISLMEAITATNNDPGTWNIQFAPALKGSTISLARFCACHSSFNLLGSIGRTLGRRGNFGKSNGGRRRMASGKDNLEE